jgi:hypothetical protein
MSPPLDIGRLTLRFTGQAPRDGARMARLVADRLAAVSIGSDMRRPIDAVQVKHTGAPGSSDDALARELAEAIVRELERMI